VNTVTNLRVAENVAKFLSSCATGGFSRRPHLRGVGDVREATRVELLARTEQTRKVFGVLEGYVLRDQRKRQSNTRMV
jgi:hypothetical protein